MSNSPINHAALQETARTLAATAGIGASDAAQLLDQRIFINVDTSNPSARLLAEELTLLLERTFSSVSSEPQSNAELEILVGHSKAKAPNSTLTIAWNTGEVAVWTAGGNRAYSCPHDPHPIFLLVGACYAAAVATKVLTGNAIKQTLSDPLIVRFDELGIDRALLSQPVQISSTFMAGAGAIGNGLLRALRFVDCRGELNIADADVVDDTNLQRQVYFTNDDINEPKATTLARRAQKHFPRLKLIPHECRLQSLRDEDDDRWLKRLIVCVDSRRARRQLQDEIAGEVFDASTTDIREAIVHYHKQPTTDACMSCIYFADQHEIAREELLAEALGLSIDDVRRPQIDQRMADAIVRHISLHRPPETLIGLPCDTLFKQLCGEGLLRLAPDKQVLAPFAFVSVLAGAMLAIELVRRLVGIRRSEDNYWRVSAWAPPKARLRARRKRRKDCEFCGSSVIREASKTLWAERN